MLSVNKYNIINNNNNDNTAKHPYRFKDDFAMFNMRYVNKINKSFINTYVNKYCMINKINYKKFIVLDLVNYKNSIKQRLYVKIILGKLKRKASYFYINIYFRKKYKNICNIKQIHNVILNNNNFYYITYIEEDDIFRPDEVTYNNYDDIKLYTAEKIIKKIIKKIIYNKLLYLFIINLVK